MAEVSLNSSFLQPLAVSYRSETPEERIISLSEVSWHDSANDCWIIIYDRVYDVTDFLDEVNNSKIEKKMKFLFNYFSTLVAVIFY